MYHHRMSKPMRNWELSPNLGNLEFPNFPNRELKKKYKTCIGLYCCVLICIYLYWYVFAGIGMYFINLSEKWLSTKTRISLYQHVLPAVIEAVPSLLSLRLSMRGCTGTIYTGSLNQTRTAACPALKKWARNCSALCKLSFHSRSN